MEIIVKQLKQGNNVIFPQTSAEAVIAKSQGQVITLDKIVSKKTIITVNNKQHIILAGHNDQQINFGDDFEADDTDNKNIKLKWNEI